MQMLPRLDRKIKLEAFTNNFNNSFCGLMGHSLSLSTQFHTVPSGDEPPLFLYALLAGTETTLPFVNAN
jgi:hypothetical protein